MLVMGDAIDSPALRHVRLILNYMNAAKKTIAFSLFSKGAFDKFLTL